jgi:hypothetical protein
MQYNTCHNQNIKLIITILHKYSTGLLEFAGIEMKFKFKFKLNLNYKLIKRKIEKCSNSTGPVSLKEIRPTIKIGKAQKGTQSKPCSIRSDLGGLQGMRALGFDMGV